MGIDFAYQKIEYPENREDQPHWSYSGFMEFRKRLAAEIDIDLDAMQGFCEPGEIYREWDTVNDAIVSFLDHSDCEGEMDYNICETVAPRLRELVAKWPDDDYDKITALRLASMMDQCAKNEWILSFR